MTLSTQDIRTLNDRRGRKISDLTNSACTWSRYIPCLVLLILLWNSFFWPSRASGSRKCTGRYHFGSIININTLPINTSTHRQTHGKYFIWSGGYTIGACDNITFTSWYALSSCSVHCNSSQCTVACRGVAKSTNYRSIRLCHRIFPRNQLNAFALVGASACKIDLIFSGSTTIPYWQYGLTMLHLWLWMHTLGDSSSIGWSDISLNTSKDGPNALSFGCTWWSRQGTPA